MAGGENQGRGRHLALLPFPIQGHISPMLQLANLLYSQGFSITIIHPKSNAPNPSNHPNFTFEIISVALLDKPVMESNIIELLSAFNKNYKDPLRDCLVRLQQLNTINTISCLITDAFIYSTHAVAEELGLPWIVLRTSSPLSFLSFALYPLLMEKGYVPIQDEQIHGLPCSKGETNATMAGGEEQEQGEQGKGHQIALFPLPFQGHINPMLQLANVLHSRGFSITIIHHHLYSPNPQTHPNFRFEPISDGLSDQQSCKLNILQLLWALNLNCERPLRECLVRLQRENPQNPVSCLITDAGLYITQAVADELEISRIVLHTNNPLSFLVFAKHHFLRRRGYFPIRDPRSEEPVAEIPPLRVKDLLDIPNVDPISHAQLVDQIMEKTKAASALIVNSFDHLEQAVLPEMKREFPLPTFMGGPLYKSYSAFPNGLLDHDRNCMEWLDKQLPGSVLYVSFGTLVEMEETELIEMVWGLANSEQPFLWVVRHGSVIGFEEAPVQSLAGFVEKTKGRGRVISWAPQQEVLAHPAVGGFWTHCGWNSTIESISEGVPMLCSPRIADQSLNARLVSYVWKVGLEVEGDVLRREEIERAVRRLMAEREGEEVRVRSRVLKEDAVTCVGKGGSSYESINKLVKHILVLKK